jgi:starch phosphorylase
MKAAINGTPHMSIGDGWWAEGYTGANGWLIDSPTDPVDHDAKDWADAQAMYQLIEEQLVPAFYERDAKGIPRGWLRIVRESIRTVLPRFTARRMLKDYVREMYIPAIRQERVLQK